jgi:regulator of sigma E protease
MAIVKTVIVILEALLMFNLLIAVHELGHFLAAKWRGLKIDRFAVWFGKPIWKKKVNGVEYALGWVPAGGYVALPQMATMEVIEGKSDSSGETLPPISALDKIIVAFAGPLFSFLLALAFAVIVWGVGKPVNEANNSTTIGWVQRDGPAWNAGLRAGDTITEVDGYRVTNFAPPSRDSLMWRIITSEGTNIVINYLREGQEHTANVVAYRRPTKWYERKALRQILVDREFPAIIYQVASNSPAALAGLRPGDRVVAMNREKIYSYLAIISAEEAMSNSPVKPVTLTIRRDQDEFERTLAPEKPIQPTNSNPSLGIMAWAAETNVTLVHPSPFDQIQDSAGQIFATIGAVVSPKSNVGVQQLGGAVMIMRLYKNLLESEHGWRLVIWFSVVLNVNLALLNLLPFPVLDGGHIVLAVLEVIRRRPVSPKLLQAIQTACAVVLIAFMLFIAFFDTGDWIRTAHSDREQPVVFAPPQH